MRGSAAAKRCFVIMPISDPDGYEAGHFSRVYEHLIKPACTASGFEVVRADDVRSTNHIVIDIAFDKSVVLIKDTRTERVFDIQGLRTIDYDSALRIDRVNADICNLSAAMSATENAEATEVNSLVRLLGIAKATPAPASSVSSEAALILSALKDVAARLTKVEDRVLVGRLANAARRVDGGPQRIGLRLPNGERVRIGETLYEGEDHNELGELVRVESNAVIIKRLSNGELQRISSDDDMYDQLTNVPF